MSDLYLIEKTSLTNIADAIRAKKNVAETFAVAEMPDAISSIETGASEEALQAEYQKGQDAATKSFWDAYQSGGTRTNYEQAFSGAGWTDDIFKPAYPIRYIASSGSYIGSLFYRSKVKTVTVPISLTCAGTGSNVGKFNSVFTASSIETIQDLRIHHNGAASPTYDFFNSCKDLRNISFGQEPYTYTTSDGDTIELPASEKFLANISFAACLELTEDSLKNILNNLSSSAQNKTLTVHIDVFNGALQDLIENNKVPQYVNTTNWKITAKDSSNKNFYYPAES